MSTWHIDQAHSEIGFKVKHLMVSSVRGFFGKFSGTLTAGDDNLTNTQVSFETETASISTNNAMRDGHLQSPDFFDVARYPKIGFESRIRRADCNKKGLQTLQSGGLFCCRGLHFGMKMIFAKKLRKFLGAHDIFH